MTRLPFDPLKTAAAQAKQSASLPAGREFGAPLRTVKQLNALLSQTLATHLPAVFAVQGELSNFRVYDRGHAFFTLKEAGAEIPCMMWKDNLARLKFTPKDGLAVVARGAVKVYEAQGKVQLYVDALFPQGTGGLELAFRQLCEKLKAEGLFELSRKRPLPRFPQRIAIITSRTGDALHDVLTTAHRRHPGLHILLFPVRVQGAQAAPEIIHAIQQLNAIASSPSPLTPVPSVILLVRGGGSLEDLWPFNEESLARAIVASRIPIATGIGHEPDTTIADLVGDLRGPTPTGITELTIPDAAMLGREIDTRAALLTRDLRTFFDAAQSRVKNLSLELTQTSRQQLRINSSTVDHLTRAIARIEPRHAIAQGWRRLEDAQRRLDQARHKRLTRARDHLASLHHRLEKASPTLHLQRARARLDSLQNQLRLVSPQTILDRGYSITMTREGKILRSKSAVLPGDILTTQLADGKITSTVGTPKQSSLF